MTTPLDSVETEQDIAVDDDVNARGNPMPDSPIPSPPGSPTPSYVHDPMDRMDSCIAMIASLSTPQVIRWAIAILVPVLAWQHRMRTVTWLYVLSCIFVAADFTFRKRELVYALTLDSAAYFRAFRTKATTWRIFYRQCVDSYPRRCVSLGLKILLLPLMAIMFSHSSPTVYVIWYLGYVLCDTRLKPTVSEYQRELCWYLFASWLCVESEHLLIAILIALRICHMTEEDHKEWVLTYQQATHHPSVAEVMTFLDRVHGQTFIPPPLPPAAPTPLVRHGFEINTGGIRQSAVGVLPVNPAVQRRVFPKLNDH